MVFLGFKPTGTGWFGADKTTELWLPPKLDRFVSTRLRGKLTFDIIRIHILQD